MALSSDDLTDIKQLLEANNHSLLVEVDEMFDQKFDEKFAPIQQQLDDLTTFVTDALDTNNERVDGQLTDHEARITTLEQSAA